MKKSIKQRYADKTATTPPPATRPVGIPPDEALWSAEGAGLKPFHLSFRSKEHPTVISNQIVYSGSVSQATINFDSTINRDGEFELISIVLDEDNKPAASIPTYTLTDERLIRAALGIAQMIDDNDGFLHVYQDAIADAENLVSRNLATDDNVVTYAPDSTRDMMFLLREMRKFFCFWQYGSNDIFHEGEMMKKFSPSYLGKEVRYV